MVQSALELPPVVEGSLALANAAGAEPVLAAPSPSSFASSSAMQRGLPALTKA
jgi:hypothetical protein